MSGYFLLRHLPIMINYYFSSVVFIHYHGKKERKVEFQEPVSFRALVLCLFQKTGMAVGAENMKIFPYGPSNPEFHANQFQFQFQTCNFPVTSPTLYLLNYRSSSCHEKKKSVLSITSRYHCSH